MLDPRQIAVIRGILASVGVVALAGVAGCRCAEPQRPGAASPAVAAPDVAKTAQARPSVEASAAAPLPIATTAAAPAVDAAELPWSASQVDAALRVERPEVPPGDVQTADDAARLARRCLASVRTSMRSWPAPAADGRWVDVAPVVPSRPQAAQLVLPTRVQALPGDDGGGSRWDFAGAFFRVRADGDRCVHDLDDGAYSPVACDPATSALVALLTALRSIQRGSLDTALVLRFVPMATAKDAPQAGWTITLRLVRSRTSVELDCSDGGRALALRAGRGHLAATATPQNGTMVTVVAGGLTWRLGAAGRPGRWRWDREPVADTSDASAERAVSALVARAGPWCRDQVAVVAGPAPARTLRAATCPSVIEEGTAGTPPACAQVRLPQRFAELAKAVARAPMPHAGEVVIRWVGSVGKLGAFAACPVGP